jgi:hypothetical protein
MLHTAVGKLDFSFGINENTKYVSGTVKSQGIDIGRAFDLKGFGPVSCKADFTFDISKPRTAVMRRKKGGKLPMGSVKAHVDEASYQKVKFRNIQADIVSDGAVAEGKLVVKGKRTDMLCSFSFTSTESMKKMKVKPGIRFHGLSEEDKQAKEEKKQRKKEDKETRKLQRAEEKAQKAEAKAAMKAAKKAQREAEKARKKEEKARKAAEKAAVAQ